MDEQKSNETAATEPYNSLTITISSTGSIKQAVEEVIEALKKFKG